jgi:hypothetical protein
MATTDFWVQANGDNRNSGSDTNATAKYTSTTGTWNGTTFVYTPTNGSNPVAAGVAVGDFASLYTDGATKASKVCRITAVTNAVNGPITLSSTVLANTALSVSPTAATIKVGGAWFGPSGIETFPFVFSGLGGLINLNSNPMRLMIKADRIYSMAARIDLQSFEPTIIQGWSDDPLVRTVFDWGTYSGSSPLWNHQTDQDAMLIGLVFQSSATTGSGNISNGGTGRTYVSCSWSGARGTAITNTARSTFIECEFYNCCRNNNNNDGFVYVNNIMTTFRRCYFHDSTGVNANGILYAPAGTSTRPVIIDCIFDSLGGSGILQAGGSGGQQGMVIFNSDFYNNGNCGIRILGAANFHYHIENCNFVKNPRYAIENASVGGTQVYHGFLFNNGFGSGTMANTLGHYVGIGAVQEVGTIVYPADQTPWKDPANGDFTLVSNLAISTGRGNFLCAISGGNVITAIPLSTKGDGYTSVPTVTISSSNVLIPAAAVASLELSTRLIINGGTGYQPGDQLAIEGGTYDYNGPAVLNVIAVGPGGTVRFEEGGNTNFTYRGKYSAVPSGTRNLLGGSGTGATATLTWRVGYVDLTSGGLYGDVPGAALVGGGSPSPPGSLGSVTVSTQPSTPLVSYPDVGAVSPLKSVVIGGGGGGGEGAGVEPMIVELPRPTIRVRDPEIAGLLRRARRAARMIEDLSIVGDQVGGNSASGFSIGGGDGL